MTEVSASKSEDMPKLGRPRSSTQQTKISQIPTKIKTSVTLTNLKSQVSKLFNVTELLYTKQLVTLE